jgi:DNA-binding response OmpR family regulator
MTDQCVARSHARKSSKTMQHTLHIGLIEDDRDACERLTLFLKNQGFEVSIAQSLRAFDQLLKTLNHPFDIILLELNLQGEDGMDIIETLRTMENVGVIVVSARQSEQSKIEAITRGADDYITKPFNVNELLARIRGLERRLQSHKYCVEYQLIHGLLSAREKSVFVSIARGKTISSVAEDMGIGVKTVETYRRRITRKLAVKSISDITRMAVKARLI